MPSMNVSLTPELIQLVQRKVASGMYNNASEFVREAIRNIDTNAQLLYELKLAKLKERLQPSIDDAENGIFADDSFDTLMKDMNHADESLSTDTGCQNQHDEDCQIHATDRIKLKSPQDD